MTNSGLSRSMWNCAVFLSLVPYVETAFHSLIVSSLWARCFPKIRLLPSNCEECKLHSRGFYRRLNQRLCKKTRSQVWQVCHNLLVGGTRWKLRKINTVPWKNEKKNAIHHRVQQAEGVIFVKGYYFYFSHGGVWRKPTQDTKVLSQEKEAGQD